MPSGDHTAARRTRRRRLGVQGFVTAAVCVMVAARFGVGAVMIPPLVAAVSLVTLAAVDLRSYRLPDAITIPATAASLVAVVVESLIARQAGAIVTAVVAAVGYTAALGAAHWLRPAALGFGDVKMAPMLGLHLGWTAGRFRSGWVAVAALVARALLLSCAIALVLALALAWLRRTGRDPLPVPGGNASEVVRTRLRDTIFPFGPRAGRRNDAGDTAQLAGVKRLRRASLVPCLSCRWEPSEWPALPR